MPTAATTVDTPSRASTDEEHVALRQLTRGTALGLADPHARQLVLADLRNAGSLSHKIDLRAYLGGPRGAVLLQAMAAALGRSPAALLDLVYQVRPLQLYMPVEQHQARWQGGTQLLVASVIGRKEVPVGYTLLGEEIALSARTAPETPTLGLVPTERRLKPQAPRPPLLASLPAGGGRLNYGESGPGGPCDIYADNCDPCQFVDECNPCLPPGCYTPDNPPPRPPQPSGIYMDRMTIRDAHEFWLRQSPEVDVILWAYVYGGWEFNGMLPQTVYHPPYFHQKRPPAWNDTLTTPGYYGPGYANSFVWNPNLQQRVYVACAGEAAGGWRHFDFNDNGDNRPRWGQALLAETEEFALIETIKDPGYFGAIAHERRIALQGPFQIEIMERDDGTQCPDSPHYVEIKGTVTYHFEWYRYTSKVTQSGWGWPDLASLFGNNNDRIAIFNFANLQALKDLNHTFFGNGGDADIVLSSHNFNIADIPPSLDPLP